MTWKPVDDDMKGACFGRDDEPTVAAPIDRRRVAGVWPAAVERPAQAKPEPSPEEPGAMVRGIWRSAIRPVEAPPAAAKSGNAAAESARAQADRYFSVAALLVERGYPREAVFEAQKAMRLCRPRPEQEAVYAWALYQRSGAGPRVPAHVWQHLDSALEADPNCALARHYLELLSQYR